MPEVGPAGYDRPLSISEIAVIRILHLRLDACQFHAQLQLFDFGKREFQPDVIEPAPFSLAAAHHAFKPHST